MNKIVYLPLEPLPERYTLQMSAEDVGWVEREWKERGIPYQRIEGETLTDEIVTGSVLDANGRGYWATEQIRKVLKLAAEGGIQDGDVIYFDDFWHPGISALPYSFEQMGLDVKMYAFCFAQSVDQFDFTYSMRHWMRHFEKGIGKILDGIFVTSTQLRDLLLYAGIGTEETVHVTGLIYDSLLVRNYFPETMPETKRQVVYSSRWDKEKCPLVFLKTIEEVLQLDDSIKFVITTSAKHVRSNDPKLLDSLQYYSDKYSDNLEIRTNQTKTEYYETLLESMIQMNTADQDWTSFTLLEATQCGCHPVYPNFLSFPESLEFNYEYMYRKNDPVDAAQLIINKIDETPDFRYLQSVYRKYDKSIARITNIMQGKEYEALYSDPNRI
jgi:glycosyltransferase involved in cell wall biosynthesis